MKQKRICAMAFLIIFCVSLHACSGKSSSSSSTDVKLTNTYGGTQPPGDYWEWLINWDTTSSGTFTATNYGTSAGAAVSHTYSGTNTLLPSRFIKFTITATTDSTASLNSSFYGVEIPGTTVLIQAGDKIIACSVIGTAPTSGAIYNWTRMPDAATMDDHTTTAGVMSYGTSQINFISGTSYTCTLNSFDWDTNTISTNAVSNLVLSNNKLFSPDITNPVSVTVLAASGCFVSDLGSDGGVFGSIAPSTNVSLTDAITKNYRGYAIMYHSSTSTSIIPIYCRPSTNILRQLSGVYINNNVEDSEDPNTTFEVIYDSANQPSPGLLFNIASTNSTPGFSESIVMAITNIDNKYVITGFGRVKPSSSPTDPYIWENFIMAQSD